MISDALFDLSAYDVPLAAKTEHEACDLGTIAEMAFLLHAKRRMWHVYVPFGHATPADAILFRPPCRPISVQIKKGQRKGDGSNGYKVMVGAGKPACAANTNDYGARYKRYERGSFDVLAMYVDEVDSFVFWTLDELVERGGSWACWALGNPRDNWEVFDRITARRELLELGAI